MTSSSVPEQEGQDLRNWMTVPDSCEDKSCWSYSRRFLDLALEAEKSNDPCFSVYFLLGKVTSLRLEFDVKGHPFGPELVLEGIDNEGLRSIVEQSPQVEDPDLRARLEDLAWVRFRNHQLGRQAVKDYLTAAMARAEQDDWMLAEDYVHRAMNLSQELRDEVLVAEVASYIETVLQDYDESHEWKYLARDLMELLIEARLGEATALSAKSERIAEHSESVRDWDRARTYWQLKARWDYRRDDSQAAIEARLHAAETHVQAAEEAVTKGGPWMQVAAGETLSAVDALRQLGERGKADALLVRALKYQEEARANAQSFSESFDVAKQADAARRAIAGKSLVEALLSLADVTSSPRVGWLRELTEEQVAAFPLQHLFASYLRDDQGRVIASRPSHHASDELDQAQAMRADMLENARLYRDVATLGSIEPARWQFLLEHHPQSRDISPMLDSSPFVPHGREALYTKGLLAGLHGDFITATHILIPQIENSIRELFKQRGLVTSKLESGVQEERDLNALLLLAPFREAALGIFGEDLAFDLQGLLVERFGANLRNKFAHGLLEEDDFSAQRPQAIYLWWLTLRLCVWPFLMTMWESRQTQHDRPDGNPNSG
jgi:hypothetical protein